jgi:adenylate cyclase, class 2
LPIEVERKARVAHPDKVRALLAQRADAEASTYHDTYYDWPDGTLEHDGRQELRVRVVETANDSQAILTFKGTPLDDTSVPEFETTVDDPVAADEILTGLGLVHLIRFQKHCRNYTFRSGSYDVKATIVQIPELDDETFIEVETIVETADQTPPATRAIHDVLTSLGLSDQELTDELYTDRVRTQRGARP